MIQLKVRTEYSFGQTFAPIPKVIDYLKQQGCTAAGIVDTNTWGHVAWFKACVEAKIQPLLGVEVVVTDDEAYTPKMWFLAVTKDGLKELYRNMSNAHRQMIQTKRGSVPRLYRAEVENMSEDILKFAGDIVEGPWLEKIGAYVDYSPASSVLNVRKRVLPLPKVYTSDNAFMSSEDRDVFEIVAKAGSKPSPQHLLRDLEITDAMKAIVARCANLELPVAPMIKVEGDLEALCRAGIVKRELQSLFATDERYETRLLYELDIIKQKEYESYFIVVADMVDFAKKHMLVGPSRGSAAGSLVCFLAGITEIDPIPPGLFFERFIDITRKDLPDIDLDFPDSKRHMVFEYMGAKYGQRKTAHIGTVMRFKPRSALVQVCKAMGIPPSATAGVKAAMIERSSADARANACLEDTLTQTEPGRKFIEAYPHAAMCGRIEGHASHTGVHAAGLLVCTDEIENYCTVDNYGIAHVEMSTATTLGLLKIDVLGLTTLTILEESGVQVDWYKLPFNDPKAFEVFNQGRMCGIFQFEGDAMRSLSQQITIESLTEVDAITALARPGPFAGGVTFNYIQRKKGLQKVTAIHPLVQEYMKETYGLPIYQEQTLAICREVGKFGWKEAAIIRKAMSKSLGVEFFNQYRQQFIEGSASNGIDADTAVKIWEMIMTMGSWQMNKAHTYSYAVISYWCAWLKAYHPLEFAASNLRCAKSEESAIELLREIVKEGIDYVAFDPNLSEVNWAAKDGRLVGGFTTIKGIGETKAKKYVELRDKGQLPAKTREELLKMPNPYLDIFPLKTAYGATLYNEESAKVYVKDKVWKIGDILKDKVEENGIRLFIGTLINKNPRNVNEDALIKKRGGKVLPFKEGQMEYLDLRLRDDTGQMGGRVPADVYQAIGLEITEKIPLGKDILVEAKFYHRRLESGEREFIPYAFIKRWATLEPTGESYWRSPNTKGAPESFTLRR